jgi:hypothetical protein
MNEGSNSATAGGAPAADATAPEESSQRKRPYRPIARMRPEDWRADNHPRWATVGEVAIYKGCGVAGVNAYLDRGDFLAVKDRGKIKVDLDSVFAYDAALPQRAPRPLRRRAPGASDAPNAPDAPKRKRGRPRKASLSDSDSDSGETA